MSEKTGINAITLKHEFVHGLFYTVPAYRQAVLKEIRRHQHQQMLLWLARNGYHEKVMDDETNAYLLTSLKLPSSVSRDKNILTLRSCLEAIFKKHFGYDIKNAKQGFILRQIHELRL